MQKESKQNVKANLLVNFMATELTTPARATFIEEVCRECDISVSTFYRWRDNHSLISNSNRKTIASMAGKNVEQLFD
jgi:transposase-like protein